MSLLRSGHVLAKFMGLISKKKLLIMICIQSRLTPKIIPLLDLKKSASQAIHFIFTFEASWRLQCDKSIFWTEISLEVNKFKSDIQDKRLDDQTSLFSPIL